MELSIVTRVAIGILGVALIGYRLFRNKKVFNLPPGPKGLPLVGNLFDLPPPNLPPYKHWAKLKEKYGPVFSLSFLGTTMVYLDSPDAIHEILEKKSLKTSGRPTLTFLGENCGLKELIVLKQYDADMRLHRKLIHQHLGTLASAQKYNHIQEVESHRFLQRLLNDPENLDKHTRIEAAAIILRITYGYAVDYDGPDPLVNLIERMMDNFSRAIQPLTWLVDIFPFMNSLPEWLPGMSYKSVGRQWKYINHMAYKVPFEFVQDSMARGSYEPSYVATYLTKGDKNAPIPEDIIMSTATIVYGGGSDTTVSTIMSFVLAMTLYPDVQRKAKEEIERVVGHERLPQFSDRDKLPYINALVKEATRWMPVVPVGTTHAADEDVTYKDMTIPKGSLLMPAIWGSLHDPKVHPDPETFNPDRFLEPRNEPDPADHAFGYGRRICPGRFLANESLFITLSRMLAVFDMTKAVDEYGREIEPPVEHTASGVIERPIPFPYKIRSRGPEFEKLAREVERYHPASESDAKFVQEKVRFL